MILIVVRGMQDCFRDHPDVYGSELADQEGEEDEEPLEQAEGIEPAAVAPSTTAPAAERRSEISESSEAAATERAKEATAQVTKDYQPPSESEELVPKAWHDTPPSIEGK